MIWIQNDYDKEHGLERWFLRPSDWTRVSEEWKDKDGNPVDGWYDAEWYATVTRCKDADGNPVDEYVATIEPADETRFEESYEEYFPTLEAAQQWAELGMSLDRRI
jgi:hypothetical protein